MMRTLASLLFGLGILTLSSGAGAEPDKKIARTWKAKCASCHGQDGKGDTEKGQKMGVRDYTTAKYQGAAKDDKMKEVIMNGLKEEKGGKKQEMDPYKDKLKPEEVDGLVQLVRSFKK